MNRARQAQPELVPTIKAALIFLAGLVVSISATFKVPAGDMFDVPALTMPAAVVSALSFFCAGMLVFWKPRPGYCLGVAGGLIIFVSIARSESALAPMTTWMYLTAGLNAGETPTFLVLRVLTVALAAIALSCSAIRMFPARWCVRGRVLRRLTWPALVAGSTVSVLWALRDATPYTIPVCRMGVWPEVTVLHVRKSGLRIQQTAVGVSRDARLYYQLAEHRIFQFRVERQTTLGVIPHEQLAGLLQPSTTWASHSAPVRSVLWSWNAERWYVLLNHSRLFAFTGLPPHEVAEFLQRAERLPRSYQLSDTGRDICLGFRYDPLAELGALTPEEKEKLLHSQ